MISADAVGLYRLLFPRSRATRQFVFHHNTSCRKSVRCIFCCAAGPTWAARWPKTARAELWEAEHECVPLIGTLEQITEATS